MTVSTPDAPRPEELEQFQAESPEAVVEIQEDPVELATQLEAEVIAQTSGLATETRSSTQHSVDVIGPDPEISQQPEMVELMNDIEHLLNEVRVLGESTNQELAEVIESEVVPDETQSDEAQESEPSRENPETVKQLIDSWKTEYDGCEDPDMKAELAYRLVKMGEALRAAHLSANEVGIQALEGAAGFYRLDTKEIFITPSGIDEPEHFQHILVHEATHAGKFTGRRIVDEGLTEIATQKRVTDTLGGVYQKEQAQTRTAFTNFDLPSVLNSYDFDHPEELITLYLQTEWKDAWGKIQSELKPGEDMVSEEGRRNILQGRLRGWAVGILKNLEGGLPDLTGEAKNVGFNFDQANLAIFEKLVRNGIGETKKMELEGQQEK